MWGGTMKALEEGATLTLDFGKLAKVAATGQDLLPVVVQDAATKEVLILAYANETALRHSLEHKVAAFWSSSRNELWVKGATSGDTLELVEIRVNCEQNSLLYLVRPLGEGACHTKRADGRARTGCYYRRIVDGALAFVEGAE
ncbi:MAG: phosphoribosyl-AMP cyclohydrolase [Chitinivibrionales bacterium]|nr:phosphoribosyl-AMP cyclohydrolase [Chitinivibrionales bacterium]